MIVNKLQDSLRRGYLSPAAEEIAIETSHQILEGSLTIPEVEEENMDW